MPTYHLSRVMRIPPWLLLLLLLNSCDTTQTTIESSLVPRQGNLDLSDYSVLTVTIPKVVQGKKIQVGDSLAFVSYCEHIADHIEAELGSRFQDIYLRKSPARLEGELVLGCYLHSFYAGNNVPFFEVIGMGDVDFDGVVFLADGLTGEVLLRADLQA